MKRNQKGEILTGMLAFVLFNLGVWTYAAQNAGLVKVSEAPQTVQVAKNYHGSYEK